LSVFGSILTTALMPGTSVQIDPAPVDSQFGPESDAAPTGMTSTTFIVFGSTLATDVTGLPSWSPTQTNPSATATPIGPDPTEARLRVAVAVLVVGSIRVRLLPG
jgi:hypothetical protein